MKRIEEFKDHRWKHVQNAETKNAYECELSTTRNL